MTLENLAAIGRLKPHAATRDEIVKLLSAAERNLRDAKRAANSDGTRYICAYTAIVQAAQAALFANGWRPSTNEPGHHMTMVQALVHTASSAAASRCSTRCAASDTPSTTLARTRTLRKPTLRSSPAPRCWSTSVLGSQPTARSWHEQA